MPPATQKPVSITGPEPVPSTPDKDVRRRRCESCLMEYPLQQFRRRYRRRDQRASHCRRCHNLRERLRRAGIRHRASRREMAKAMTRLTNCSAAARAPAFCAEMVQHFGGAVAFLDAWKDCIGRDLARGGLSAYRHIASIVRLMEHYENAQPAKPDYSTMTDEELLDRLTRAESSGY